MIQDHADSQKEDDLSRRRSSGKGKDRGHARAFQPDELGAAAYAIKAVQTSAPRGEAESAGRAECRWQRAQLPEAIRELVLDDQRLRNAICWFVFEC